MLYPILDLRVEAESHEGSQRNSEFDQADGLINRLSQLKTRNSDEALVVLMNLYVGEAPGGDLLHYVTKRGKRMLPLLLKYRGKRVVFPGKSYPASIFLDLDARKRTLMMRPTP